MIKYTISTALLGDLGPVMRATLAELTSKPRQEDYPDIMAAGGIVQNLGTEILQRGTIDTEIFLALKEMSADVLGWAFVLDRAEPTVSVFVSPFVRRQGIGTALVKAVHESVVKKVRLVGSAHDPQGEAFYASLKDYVRTYGDIFPSPLPMPPRGLR